MKLNKKELEMMVLKHLLTHPDAMIRAQRLRISRDHFTYAEEGSTVCYTNLIYALFEEYYEKSSGSLMTILVLENKLIETQTKDKHRGKLMVLWAEIQDQEADPNELYDLLMRLKHERALKAWGKLHKEGHETMSAEGLEEGCKVVRDYVDTIEAELSDEELARTTFDMTSVSDTFERELIKRRDHPEQYRGIACGLDEIDSQTMGWMPGQLIVLLSHSSGGKSVQMLNWANHAHKVEGKRVLYFSFEMDWWLCCLRHISLVYRLPYHVLKGVALDNSQLAELVARMPQGGDNQPYFEYDVNLDSPTPEYVERRIRELTQSKGKPDLVVCDYIGNMYSEKSRQESKKWEKEGDAVEGLFKIARRHAIPILTAQQLNSEGIRENRKLKQSGKQAAYSQDMASGDKRLIHLCTYAIALEPHKEHGAVVYQGVKMRDASFPPFAAKWHSQQNRVEAVYGDERNDLMIALGINISPDSGGTGLNVTADDRTTYRTEEEDDGQTVAWGTGSMKYTPEDLTTNADDLVMDWGDMA